MIIEYMLWTETISKYTCTYIRGLFLFVPIKDILLRTCLCLCLCAWFLPDVRAI